MEIPAFVPLNEFVLLSLEQRKEQKEIRKQAYKERLQQRLVGKDYLNHKSNRKKLALSLRQEAAKGNSPAEQEEIYKEANELIAELNLGF